MDFRVLGPVGLLADGEMKVLHGARQRTLLALLLINSGDVVAKAKIFEELWGGEPPIGADNALQALVTRFRRVLRNSFDEKFARQCLVTRPDGYAMHVDPETIDVRVFERLTAQAREKLRSEPERARGLLDQALALWQGPALQGATGGPICHSAAEQFEEARLAATEDLIRVKIAIRGHASVISELKSLSFRHPWRERLAELLMVCLYRAGRQAEAIQTYNHVRCRLVTEFGMEPSPSLKRCMTAVLNQDPALGGDRSMGVRDPLPRALVPVSA